MEYVKANDTDRLVPRTLVEAVKDHAREHYNDGGWDVIVECAEDEEIARMVGQARTAKGAIRKVAEVVSIWAERQADALISAGEPV